MHPIMGGISDQKVAQGALRPLRIKKAQLDPHTQTSLMMNQGPRSRSKVGVARTPS
jgi:hypothetical protein